MISKNLTNLLANRNHYSIHLLLNHQIGWIDFCMGLTFFKHFFYQSLLENSNLDCLGTFNTYFKWDTRFIPTLISNRIFEYVYDWYLAYQPRFLNLFKIWYQSNPYFVLSSTLAHDESGMVLNKVPQLMDQFFIQFATQIISFLQTQICVGFTPPHISGLSNGHKNLQSYPAEKYIHRSM